MSKIKLLSQDLINQIAAGEVVERPASVVKELVENSIDAAAQSITIQIENGGLQKIKVMDDGIGMDRDDAILSVKQHATSKINSQNDLFSIGTMGFRGEALASISSISKFRLITKKHGEVKGTEIQVDEPGVTVRDVGTPEGTSIEISELFYNIPARRKYLKTAVTEFNHITDLFLNFCLAYPQINWKLFHNNKPVYQFPKTNIEQRIFDVLGSDISRNLIKINYDMNGVNVVGFIGKPQVARNNRKLQYLFINNRPVNEYIIAKQVKDSFATLIPHNLYPVFILNIQVDLEKVDVNVHPRKMEVRFSEPQLIYSTIYRAISRTLDDSQLQKNSFCALY